MICGRLDLLLMFLMEGLCLVRGAGVLLHGPEVEVAVLPEQLLQLHPVLDLLPEGGEQKIGQIIGDFLLPELEQDPGAGGGARLDVSPGQGPRRPLPGLLRQRREARGGRVGREVGTEHRAGVRAQGIVIWFWEGII